jgi:hypothetical protein
MAFVVGSNLGQFSQKGKAMRYQMAIVGAICLAVGSLVGTFASDSVVAQSSTTTTGNRYQMSLKPAGGNSSSTTVFVCDTTTGRCWYRETLGEVKGWTDMGSPHSSTGK